MLIYVVVLVIVVDLSYQHIVTTPPEFKSYKFYPVVADNQIEFRVKATDEVYLALTTRAEESDPMYEFCIGCWKNKWTTLKRSRSLPYKVEVEIHDVLHGEEFRGFWVRWLKNGNIYAGREGETKPFIVWNDPEPFPIGYFGIGSGLGAKGTWDLKHYITTPPQFVEYKFFPVIDNTVRFRVKAAHEIYLALTSGPEQSDPMYEYCFGGWKNTRSVLKRDRKTPFKVEVELPGILNGDEFRGFWIKWDTKGNIFAGHEGQARPFLLWTDPKPFKISYFGIGSGLGAKGIWDIQDISTTPEQFESYQFYPVTSRQFIQFKVQATDEVYLALTSGPEESDPMYEFCIGCWKNTRTTIKRSRVQPYKVQVELNNLLSGKELRGFWVRWNSRGIYAGKEGEVRPFMLWNDPEPFPIRYFGIGTGLGAKGTWDLRSNNFTDGDDNPECGFNQDPEYFDIDIRCNLYLQTTRRPAINLVEIDEGIDWGL